jgi:hypothetical protein
MLRKNPQEIGPTKQIDIINPRLIMSKAIPPRFSGKLGETQMERFIVFATIDGNCNAMPLNEFNQRNDQDDLVDYVVMWAYSAIGAIISPDSYNVFKSAAQHRMYTERGY